VAGRTAAEFFKVSRHAGGERARRYRDEGPDRAGVTDRASAGRTQPAKTPAAWVGEIVRLRLRQHSGQCRSRLGVPASTLHAVLVRCRMTRLSHIDRVTDDPSAATNAPGLAVD
jgi:hypothetical protein